MAKQSRGSVASARRSVDVTRVTLAYTSAPIRLGWALTVVPAVAGQQTEEWEGPRGEAMGRRGERVRPRPAMARTLRDLWGCLV